MSLVVAVFEHFNNLVTILWDTKMAQSGKQMSFADFKKSSLKTISKNLQSPYDPKTMKSFSPAPIVNKVSTKRKMRTESNASPIYDQQAAKTKKMKTAGGKVDRSRSFLDLDQSDSECHFQKEDGYLSGSSLFGNQAPPKLASTPLSQNESSGQNVIEELKEAKSGKPLLVYF